MPPTSAKEIISIFTTSFSKYALSALVLCAALTAISIWIRRRSYPTTNRQIKMKLSDLSLTARRPLTPFEETMFFALSAALPECVVLAQVSFQALLDTPKMAYRNRFNRKSADFVICSKQLTPIAVVELDDESHNSKKTEDADRDAMLKNVGYQTIRYRKIPTSEQIKADVENALKMLTTNVTSNGNQTTNEHYL